jgi:8-oxo-dGTP diphosphatase
MPDALIAVAVVTSSRGVLLGRRRDGNPPWTFPGGKAEPGETPAEAAVRETAEETGVAVTATGEIGRRTHPATGRLVVYVAAVPADDGETRAGKELTEVRWVTPEEADELAGGTVFEPVRLHIRQAPGPQNRLAPLPPAPRPS